MIDTYSEFAAHVDTVVMIRLFGGAGIEIPLQLIKTQGYNGITDLIYTRRE